MRAPTTTSPGLQPAFTLLIAVAAVLGVSPAFAQQPAAPIIELDSPK